MSFKGRELDPTPSFGTSGSIAVPALLAAIVVGAAVRVLPFLGTDFPLNDGGLFLAMTQDLQQAGYAIPQSTYYNGAEIPYTYPPLGFYLAGGLNDLLGVPLLDLFRILPLLLSVATIPAFALVARQLLPSGEAAFAALAFALLPRSWEWMVVGGGITRAVGFTLALLALAATIRLLRAPTARWMAITGVAGGLTALAHPQAVVFLVLSVLLVALCMRPGRIAIGSLLASAVVAVVCLTPWLLMTVATHGVAPFLSAMSMGGGTLAGLFQLLAFRFTGAPFMDVIGLLGLAGVAVSLARGRWLFAVWLALAMIVDARAGASFGMVPLAMLAGITAEVGVRALRLAPGAYSRHPLRLVRDRPLVALSVAGILAVSLIANYGAVLKPLSALHELSPEHRQAIAWAEGNLPPTSGFAVLSGSNHWPVDPVSEWFGALAPSQRSVATPQGFEWLGSEQWTRQRESYTSLQACGRELPECLSAWRLEYHADAAYVFVQKGSATGPSSPDDCCPALREALRSAGAVVYDGPGATIAHIDGAP